MIDKDMEEQKLATKLQCYVNTKTFNTLHCRTQQFLCKGANLCYLGALKETPLSSLGLINNEEFD